MRKVSTIRKARSALIVHSGRIAIGGLASCLALNEGASQQFVAAGNPRASFPAGFASAVEQLLAAHLLRRVLQLNSGSVRPLEHCIAATRNSADKSHHHRKGAIP